VGDDVGERKGAEGGRAEVRARAVGAPPEGLPAEERVLQILAERAAQAVGDLRAQRSGQQAQKGGKLDSATRMDRDAPRAR